MANEKTLLTRGPFMCTSEHAVDVAYFVSQLELASEHGMPAIELGAIIQRYQMNSATVEELCQELQDFVNDVP